MDVIHDNINLDHSLFPIFAPSPTPGLYPRRINTKTKLHVSQFHLHYTFPFEKRNGGGAVKRVH